MGWCDGRWAAWSLHKPPIHLVYSLSSTVQGDGLAVEERREVWAGEGRISRNS